MSALAAHYTPEHQMFRETCRRFFEKEVTPFHMKWEEQGIVPRELWRKAGEQGLLGMTMPEEYGGVGADFLYSAILIEEQGRALASGPAFSLHNDIVVPYLLHYGTEEQKKALLPKIASGEITATLAFDGPLGAAPTVAKGGKITGTKTYVLDGHTANLIIVAAKTGKGTSLFAVDGKAAGLTRTALSTMDQTRKQAKLEFSNTPATLLGTEGEGWKVLGTVLDLAAVGLAAEQVGGAQKVLEMAVDYAKVRVQFGRPIGSFQAIKHKCADMLLEVESAKSAAYYGMWCAAEMNDELASVASLAKAYCSEAYFHATAENIQIHGGIGFTWEHPAHLYFKRAKSSELLFGDPTYHRELLARRIGI